MSSIELRLDSGVSIAGEAPLCSAVSVWLPRQALPCPIALVSLAGGNMNRRYYDLRPPPEGGGGDLRPADAPDVSAQAIKRDGRVPAPASAPTLRGTVSPAHSDESYSFAAQMTARGFIVVALDHLGLGDSSKPADGYVLTPGLLAEANRNATAEVLARLREGRLASDLKAMPGLRSIGVGHSMGAMMTVLQQALARQHVAIALLGFATRGLPDYLPKDVVALPQAEQRAGLVEFARKMFVVPYPVIRSSGNGESIYGSAKAEARGIAALKVATDCLLPVPAYMSMLPGNVAPEAARIDVPVFIGVGERDMTGPPEKIPEAFSASPGVNLCILPETGHSHFLFPARTELFERLAHWAESVADKAN